MKWKNISKKKNIEKKKNIRIVKIIVENLIKSVT